MAARKKTEFEIIEPNKNVYTSMEEATKPARGNGKQDTAPAHEAAERRESMQTQGRKGCKLPRMSMAFSQSNYDFVRTMSRASGMTFSGFCNHIIATYREDHKEEEARMKAATEAIEAMMKAEVNSDRK